MAIINAVVRNTHLLVQGELLQLSHRRNFNMTYADYIEVITCKTGQLFELATHLAALLAAPQQIDAAKAYGLNLGIAFQMMDDLLDYQGNAEQIGKNIGDDLRDGSLTLPLLYILQSGHAAHIESVKQAIDTGHIEPLQQAIVESGAIAYTQQLAQEYTHRALAALDQFPQNIYTDALIALAGFAIKRNH
jgi:octaprenyl-diphosphate synthase